jgi:hypothetical protein
MSPVHLSLRRNAVGRPPQNRIKLQKGVLAHSQEGRSRQGQADRYLRTDRWVIRYVRRAFRFPLFEFLPSPITRGGPPQK